MKTTLINQTTIDDSGQAFMPLLARQPFVTGLGEQAMRHLIDEATLFELDEGEFLFRQEAEAEHFFVVLAGELKLHRLSYAGNEKVVARVGPDDSFAEGIAFMNEPRYPVHAQAIQACRVLGLSRDSFRRQLARAPQACLDIMALLTDRIQNLLDEIENLTLHSSRDRVIRFLLDLAQSRHNISQRQGTAITLQLPCPKHAIASQLSIRAETLSRILAGLIEQQLIQRTQALDELHIPDPWLLQQAITAS